MLRSTPGGVGRPRLARRIAVCFTALVVGSMAVVTTPQARAADGAQPTASTLPSVLPNPQEMTSAGADMSLSGKVTVVAGADADAKAVEQVVSVLRDLPGAQVSVSRTPDASGDQVWVGTAETTPGIDGLVASLGGSKAATLPADGYVIASGRRSGHNVIALQGKDARGTFYAVQTLRQLVRHDKVASVTVRDWPLMPIRGGIEGFYGIPWSHQARLDQFTFYGRHKMNTYIYTPKDDLLLRAKWRTLYSGDDLARMKELVEGANANHVDFTFALSPGNDICYSSDADFKATIAKFDQLRSLGVRSFYIALDDIEPKFHCDADRQKYPNNGDGKWIADAQADYLNRLETEYVKKNGLPPLQTVPTNYSGSGEDPYKAEFGTRLDKDIRVQWTGEGVFSPSITESSVARAAQSYHTKHLYIWDNFPVNDGRRNRLFLNPLTNRDPNLYKHIDGITSNPMIEPYASMPALANYGDYTWNPTTYDAKASMSAVLDELAGGDKATRAALRVFADLNQSWPYRTPDTHAPALTAAIDAFWAVRDKGSVDSSLKDRLAAIVRLPEALAGMRQQGFFQDTRPWINAASQWARAGQHFVTMLDAIDAGDGAKATNEYLAAQKQVELAKRPTVDDQGSDGVLHKAVIVPSVGDGVFDAFAKKASAQFAAFIGARPASAKAYSGTASSSMGQWEANSPSRMVDGNLSTLYWTNVSPEKGSYVQVDLGSVKPIGQVAVHQADDDTATGDMFYHAALEYSVDGSTWTAAGNFDSAPLIKHTFEAPVQARYVRVRATDANPGAQWVKIREFEVTPPVGVYSTNVKAAEGSSVALAFDGDVSTAFRAATPVKAGDFVSFVPAKGVTPRQAIVVGTARGEIQVRSGQTWTTIGTISDGAPFHAFAVPAGTSVEEVRLMLAAGSPAPVIRGMTVVDRELKPTPTPTPTSTAALTSGSSTGDDHGRPGYPTPTSTPSHGPRPALPSTGV